MNRCHLPVVPLVLALAVLASCQASVPPAGPPPAMTAAGISAIAAPSTIRVSLAGLRGWRRAGRRLSDLDGAAIASVRLTCTGPGITTPIVATAPFTADADSLPAVPLAGDIAIAVPPGKNRVFTLEGLDASGRVIALMRTLGSLGGGNQRLTINANTDAAARVLASLLAGPQSGDAADAAGVAGTLAGQDLTVSLLTYVTELTGYDAAANTYSGAVPPVNFRDRRLADLLRTDGRGTLEAHAPDELRDAAGAQIDVRVVEDGVPVGGADVTLYDPYHSPVQTDGDGQASFTSVPPGTWTVIVEAGGKTYATTVTARDQETADLKTIDMALAGTITLPDLPAVTTSDGFPSIESLPWVETLAGATRSSARIDALDPRVGTELGQVGVDGDGATYVMSYGKVLKLVDEDTVQVVARAATFGSGTGIAGADLRAFAMAADGTVWLVDSEKTLYRVPAGEMPTAVGTLAAQPDTLIVTAAGKLFARSLGRIDEVNTATGASTLLATVDGGGPLAADVAGNLYAWTGANLVKVTAAGGQSVLGGGSGGDEDGPSTVGRFASVSGLAVGGATLYVADAGNHRIRSVDLATGAIGTVAGGVIGRLDGSFAGSAGAVRFNRPSAVAYDVDTQALVVTDSGNHRIRRVGIASSQATTELVLTEPDHLEGTRTAARFGALAGITIDPDGNVYAADADARVVWRITTDGDAMRFAGSGQQIVKAAGLPRLSAPITVGDLAVSTTGDLFLASLPAFLVDGTGLASAVAFERAWGIAADGLGHIFELTDEIGGSRVHERTSQSSRTVLLSGLPSGGRHLAVTASGKFYIATMSQVLEVDTVAAPGTVRTILDAEVRGLCVDGADGHLFATLRGGAGGGVVKEIDPVTLDVTTLAGTGSAGVDDGAAAGATFTSEVSGIAIDGERRLYVADGDRIRRVVRF